jgi:hypothetical protein
MEDILMSFALVEDYINSLDEKGKECVYEFAALKKDVSMLDMVMNIQFLVLNRM